MADHRTVLSHNQTDTQWCPICAISDKPLQLWRSGQAVASDLDTASRLHATWWPPDLVQADSGALKDSADLMYGYPADILSCPGCHSLYRAPDSIPADIHARYREDRYPPQTLDRLWDRYTQSYHHDREWMLEQLTPTPDRASADRRPELLEIGSHVGAFLAYAGAHGWSAHGLDVGIAVTRYAQSRGVNAREVPFSPDDYAPNSLDAVWILNCFEHFPDPVELLLRLASILRPGARLILRTPRAEGIRALYGCRPNLLSRVALTQDNALGIPFPRCYSEQGLIDLLLRSGYDAPQVRRRRLVSVAPNLPGSGRFASLRTAARTTTADASLRIWRHLPAGDPRTWMDMSAIRRHEHTSN